MSQGATAKRRENFPVEPLSGELATARRGPGRGQARPLRSLATAELSAGEALELLTSQLSTVERIVVQVGRKFGLPAQEMDDFGSRVKLHLLEDGCAVLRRWRREASLATYLVTVVTNCFRDFRIERWGRWRPSRRAKRLGQTALWLEALRDRDGFTLAEAIEILLSRHGAVATRAELYALAAQLPGKTRRRFEDDAGLEDQPSAERASERIDGDEARALQGRLGAALTRAVATLEPEDRLLLELRYERGLSLKEIAGALSLRQRLVYSRHERCLLRLRREIEAQGLGWGEVEAVLGLDVPEDQSRAATGALPCTTVQAERSPLSKPSAKT